MLAVWRCAVSAGGRGTFDFCGGGAFDFLPPSADGSEGLPRRVRRRWLLAAQRRGWLRDVIIIIIIIIIVIVIVVVVVVLAGRVRRWT